MRCGPCPASSALSETDSKRFSFQSVWGLFEVKCPTLFWFANPPPEKKNHSWYLSAPARQGKCFNQMNMDTEASGFDQDRVRVTDWWRKKTKSIQTSKNCGDNSDTCSGPKCFSSAFERFQSRYYWNFWVYVIEMIQDWSLLNCQVHEVVHDFSLVVPCRWKVLSP